MKNYRAMTDAELNERINELTVILNGRVDDTWDVAYEEYNKIRAIQDARYRAANREAFEAFYEKHIKGKTWEEVDPDAFQTYSDWHKDMYGFRPRTL